MTQRLRSRCLAFLVACSTLMTTFSPLAEELARELPSTQLKVPSGGPTVPILFVTQFPIAEDFATIGSTFANHFSHSSQVGRGGDLYIRYPGAAPLCNVTRENGYGEAEVFQGSDSIAVRDPYVHPDGTRALFSMVIGATDDQFVWTEEYWQLYEVTGLGSCATTAITKIAQQPEDYNNLTPIYSPDGRVIFSSDRPRDGQRHLYPQHDEYESTPINTGLWSLDPQTGDLDLLNHSPSGVFSPIVDSFGRVIFTRWDHLQRDQQAEGAGNPNGTFDWLDESAQAAVGNTFENFPESRLQEPGSTVNGHTFNIFTPWQIHPDGREEETLNHIGRHELQGYFNRSFNNDPALIEFIESVSGRFNPNPILNFFQISEDPSSAGTFYGTDAPEFGTHASGRIVRMAAPPSLSADQIAVTYVTHPVTNEVVPDGQTPPPEHTGC